MAIALSRKATNLALPIALAAMDGCWIYLIAWLFSTGVLSRIGNIPVPSPVALAALELGAWWLATLLLDKTPLPMGVAQALTGVCGLGAALGVAALTNPPASGNYSMEWLGYSLFGMVVSLALWAIGGYRASEPPTFNQAYADFRVGIIMIAVGALITAFMAGPRTDIVWAGVGGVSLWFFGWALAALALGNREVVRAESGNAGVGPWGLVLAISIGGILLIGAITGGFGGQNVLDLIQKAVLGFFELIAGILYAILYGIFFVIALFKPELKGMGPVNRDVDEDGLPRMITNHDSASNLFNFGDLQALDALRIISLVLAALVLLVVVIWLVSRGVRRTRRRGGAYVTEDRESLGGWALLLQQLRSWLDRLFGRKKDEEVTANVTTEDDLSSLQGRAEWSGTLSVRQIYARLQRLAATLGYPRAPQQTPVEYLSVLSGVMPNLSGDFIDITAAYIEARYGPLPASGPAVMAATNAWKRAEPALQARSVKRET